MGGRLARLDLEPDVVLVQVELALLVARDGDGDRVVLVRPESGGRHRLRPGDRGGEGHVLTALVGVGVDERAAGGDEDDEDGGDDAGASSAHAFPPSYLCGRGDADR